MQRIIPNDDGLEKALVMLASFPDDVIRNVVRLTKGNTASQVLALVAKSRSDAGWGTPTPYKIFSDVYISNFEQFYYTFMGLNAQMVTGLMKKDTGGQDLYQEVFEVLFKAPPELAREAAAKVETYDIIGGLQKGKSEKVNYLTALYDNAAEAVRRFVNAGPKILGLPIEVDQDQKADDDKLYELYLLGQGANKFAMRLKSIHSQALIAQNMGMFSRVGTEVDSSGLAGDMSTTDKLGHLVARAMDTTPYSSYFHDGGKITKNSQRAARAALLDVKQRLDTGDLAEGDLVGDEVGDMIYTGDPQYMGGLTTLVLTPALRKLLSIFSEATDNQRKTQEAQATLGDIFSPEAIGDLVEGDASTLVQEIGDLIDDDEGDISAEGDVYNEGGLFRKARAKIIRKAATRRQNRALRKVSIDTAKKMRDRPYEEMARAVADSQFGTLGNPYEGINFVTGEEQSQNGSDTGNYTSDDDFETSGMAGMA